MAKIYYDPAFGQSLSEIQNYIIDHFQSKRAALRIRKQILTTIKPLSSFPDSGNFLSNLYPDIIPELRNHRRLVSGHYIITYLYLEESDEVYIQDLYDSRTDYASKITDKQ